MDKIALETDVNNGLSSYQIADKYKKSQTTIRYWLKQFGLKTKGLRTRRTSYHRKYETMDWIKLQQVIDGGGTWRDLQLNGYSNNSLAWAKKNGKLCFRSISNSAKLAWKTGKQNPEKYRTPEHRKKMSRFGGLKPNSGRCKHIKYTMTDGTVVDIQGTWELKFVEFLDVNKIQWERNRVGYKYQFKNKEHQYFPDFYLPDYNIFIEVKGYETEKDRAKWNEFPFELLIVKKQEIHDLTAWWKTISL